MQCSYERFGKNMWASFFVLFISFYKVVIQSKNNIPFLQRRHSAGMHIFRSLCKQLPTFVRGRRMVPCAAEGGWTKTSQGSLQRGIGQEMDLRGRFSLGVRNLVVNKWQSSHKPDLEVHQVLDAYRTCSHLSACQMLPFYLSRQTNRRTLQQKQLSGRTAQNTSPTISAAIFACHTASLVWLRVPHVPFPCPCDICQ